MPPPETVVFRADASPEIGIGHVMRCLALAHAWQAHGGKVVFALATGACDLENRIRSHGVTILIVEAVPGSSEDAARTLEICAQSEPAWLVVDGYHFSADYLESLSTAKKRLLVIADDDEFPGCECDIMVDPNLESAQTHLRLGHQSVLLRGPAYALLRREFLDYARLRKAIPDNAVRVLITFGGGDLPNASLVALRALQDIIDRDLDVTVVIGPSNRHRAILQAAVKECRHTVRLLENVDNIPELMAHADLAITAGGGTSYELAFMQVPMILVPIADNQIQPANAFASAKAAITAGPLHSLNRKQLSALLGDAIRNRVLRAQLAEAARAMVDGRGAERVAQRMLAIAKGGSRRTELRN